MSEQVRVRVAPEYPGLVVSSDGRIQGPGRWHPTWLKATEGNAGYLRFSFHGGSRQVTLSVHVVVCTAFHGQRPSPGHDVRHLNGNKLDNRAVNLSWGTKSENQRDRVTHGTDGLGERNHLAKLTEEQVREIRERRKCGSKLSALSDRYRVSETTVSDIARRRTWRHI